MSSPPHYAFNVTGMTCGSCVNHLTSKLTPLPNVTSVVVSLDEKRADVSGGDPEEILAAIIAAGFQAEPLLAPQRDETAQTRNGDDDGDDDMAFEFDVDIDTNIDEFEGIADIDDDDFLGTQLDDDHTPQPQQQEEKTKEQEEQQTTHSFSVIGMRCGYCVNKITTNVSTLPGVVDVNVSLDDKTVQVRGGDASAILEMLKSLEYSVYNLAEPQQPQIEDTQQQDDKQQQQDEQQQRAEQQEKDKQQEQDKQQSLPVQSPLENDQARETVPSPQPQQQKQQQSPPQMPATPTTAKTLPSLLAYNFSDDENNDDDMDFLGTDFNIPTEITTANDANLHTNDNSGGLTATDSFDDEFLFESFEPEEIITPPHRQQHVASPTTLAYSVVGMKCGNCVGKVTNNLKLLPHVDDVVVSLEDKRVDVTGAFDKALVLEKLRELGFTVEYLPVQTTDNDNNNNNNDNNHNNPLDDFSFDFDVDGDISTPVHASMPQQEHHQEQEQQKQQQETYTLSIEGMRCGSCVNKITTNVQQMPNVAAINVSLDLKQATVTCDDLQEVIEAITNLGFTCTRSSPNNNNNNNNNTPQIASQQPSQHQGSISAHNFSLLQLQGHLHHRDLRELLQRCGDFIHTTPAAHTSDGKVMRLGRSWLWLWLLLCCCWQSWLKLI